MGTRNLNRMARITTKNKRGGRRPGSGRPTTSSEWMWCRLRRETRVNLDRFARSIGLRKEERKAYWDAVFTALLGKVDLQEPEYLLLARAITVRTVE